MQRSKVLLPEPLLPIIEITSPSLAESETPLRTSNSPKLLCRSSTTNAAAGSAIVLLPRPVASGHDAAFQVGYALRQLLAKRNPAEFSGSTTQGLAQKIVEMAHAFFMARAQGAALENAGRQ